ncbi:MAG: FAD:protein FMN transferase [Bacteroidales bacterium]
MYKVLLIIGVSLMLITGCGNRQNEMQLVILKGEVFGTYYTVSYYDKKGTNYAPEIESFFDSFNESLSYYVPNSVISKINRNETNEADEYFLSVLEKSLAIAEKTNGAFDPTMSPLVNAWGFGFENRQKMDQQKIDSMMRITGYDKVSIEGNRVIKKIPEIQFDFNAIAKGYASDLAGKILEEKGVETYMVELGGDLVAKGLKPDGSKWRIGLEKPAEDMYAQQEWEYLVKITNQALATSGSYRKYYEEGDQRFSHTIDPKTGRPVKHNLLSASVFANTCLEADAYATAFMVMGLEKATEFVENRDDLMAFFIFSNPDGEYDSRMVGDMDIIPRSEL